jgi:hypothetical protein
VCLVFIAMITVEGVVTKNVMLVMTADAWCLSWVIGRRNFLQMLIRNVSGVSRFFMTLRDIAMSGYDVWVDRMLGRRW